MKKFRENIEKIGLIVKPLFGGARENCEMVETGCKMEEG
jgi:hypothetical protein